MKEKPFIPAWLRKAKLNPYEFSIYCYVASVGDCWSSFETIAEETGMSRRKVVEVLAVLVGRGLIEKISDYRGRKSNTYRITAGTAEQCTPCTVCDDNSAPDAPFQDEQCAPCTVSSANSAPHALQQCTPCTDNSAPDAPKGNPFEGYPLKEEAGADVREETENSNFDQATQPEHPAAQIIHAVDRAIAGSFGSRLARPYPAQTDFFTAQAWLALGLTVDECSAVAGPIVKRLQASGQAPPRALKYFDAPMQRAAQAKQTTGERYHVQASKTESLERVDALERARNRLTRYPRPGLDGSPAENAGAVLSAAPG
jgi:hypothetical protein